MINSHFVSSVAWRALIVIFAATLAIAWASAAEPTFPGESWTKRQPAEVGLDSKQLDEFGHYVGGLGCIVRHGFLVYEWGAIDRRRDVASCCKPWFTHFLFEALEQSKIKSVDDLVAAIEPRLTPLNPELEHKDRRITWSYLANQTSCYGVRERPGTAFDYSDFNMALFYDSLIFGVYGSSAERATQEILRPRLTDVLECQDEPRFDVRGRLAISARDFCRFGLLYLHGGNWNGRQLVSADHVRTILGSPLANTIPRTEGQKAEMIAGQRSLGGGSNQTDHLGSYSWAWWTNGIDRNGRRHWPQAPVETFAALGNFGKRALFVVPTLDMIVTWNDSAINGPEMEDHALGLVIKANSEPRHVK